MFGPYTSQSNREDKVEQAKDNRASKLCISSVKLDSAGPRDLFLIQG